MMTNDLSFFASLDDGDGEHAHDDAANANIL
jgi:hypothetical protein